MRVWLALGVVLAVCSCRGCGDEQKSVPNETVATPAEVRTGSGTSARFVPKQTTRIGYDDTVPIETIEVEPQSRDWTKKDPGEPKVLLTGKHLELADQWPAGKNRGFVQVLDGEGPSAEVVSTHLVDFEKGSILEFEDVWTPSARKFGLARATAEIDGRVQDVLLHTEDGHMVPWRQGPFENAEFLLHPGTGHVWLFVNDDAEGKTKYSHWTETRTAPPLPDRELPLHFELPTEENRNKIDVPNYFNPSPVPIILIPHNLPIDCPVIELRADGSAPCITDNSTPLADGWRIMPELGDGAIANTKTGELVLLEGSEDCSLTRFHTAQPPRARFVCNGIEGSDYLWGPERTVRLPQGPGGWGHYVKSVDGRTVWIDVRPRQELEATALHVLDLANQQRYEAPPGKPIDYRNFGGLLPVRPAASNHEVWLLSLDSGTTDVLTTRQCNQVTRAALSEHAFALFCLERRSKTIGTRVVHPGSGSIWELRSLEELWLQDDPLVLAGLQRTRRQDELVSWSFTP